MNGVVFYRGMRYDITPPDRAPMAGVGPLVDAAFAHGSEQRIRYA